jgi:hypothetical protein
MPVTNNCSGDADKPPGGGITLKRRRTVLENTRFRVFADHIADSKGNEVESFLVVVPRSQRSNLLRCRCTKGVSYS